MIEILLEAERALAVGLVDQAERLYRQAADADPRNSIAVVGLARVALERADEPEAWREARRALAIDPENVAAQRLADRLEEVWAYRGESLPDAAAAHGADMMEAAQVAEVTAEAEVAQAAEAGRATEGAEAAGVAGMAEVTASPAPVEPIASARTTSATAATTPTARREPSVIDRLLRRNRP